MSTAAAPPRDTPVLIIGAGPFGLSLAAYLKDLGVDCLLAGRPMSFWRENMPAGMFLRSGLDWHLDVQGEATLEAYASETGLSEADVLPLSRDRYLEYAAWFAARKAVAPEIDRVQTLALTDNGRFIVQTGEETITAGTVVVATGFREHAHLPEDVVSLLPEGRFGHTCDVVDFSRFRDRSVLIVGGRQSAFESAALIAEAGASAVHVIHRHATPDFTPSDWSWVEPLMRRTEREPGWYRQLSGEERTRLDGRFWAEGRSKLEPWLAPRLEAANVSLWPSEQIRAVEAEDGRLRVLLGGGARLPADYVLLATGYRFDVRRLPFLAEGLLSRIETRNGFPMLDTALQSSVNGLYFTSMAATQDFGAFFAFTVSACASSRLIGESLLRRLGDGQARAV